MGKYSQWLGTSDLPFLLPKWLLWKCGLPVALLWKLNGQANGLSKGNGQIADLWGLVDLCWLPPRRFETVQGKKWYQNSLFYAIPLAATVVERRSHTKTCNSSTHIGYRADFFLALAFSGCCCSYYWCCIACLLMARFCLGYGEGTDQGVQGPRTRPRTRNQTET